MHQEVLSSAQRFWAPSWLPTSSASSACEWERPTSTTDGGMPLFSLSSNWRLHHGHRDQDGLASKQLCGRRMPSAFLHSTQSRWTEGEETTPPLHESRLWIREVPCAEPARFSHKTCQAPPRQGSFQSSNDCTQSRWAPRRSRGGCP